MTGEAAPATSQMPAGGGFTTSGQPPPRERIPTGPETGQRPASAEEPTRDWASQDLRDPDANDRDVSYRNETARERPRRAGTAEDRFFDEERVARGDEEVAEVALRKARVSWLSVIGLVLGVVGVLTALTGELAPIAVVAGVIGLLFAVGGLVATSRAYVASRPLALLALLACLGALALAVMAFTGQFDWLNRNDQAGWLREWLNSRIPGLDRW